MYLAYAIVSIVWGSTYLAIRVGVQEMPPFWMAGVRFMVAGLLLGGYALATGRRLPRDPGLWSWMILTGLLILGVAVGIMFWAEQYIDSGLAALLTGISPILMAVYGSFGVEGDRLTPALMSGLVVSLVGVGILVDPQWATADGGLQFAAVGSIVLIGGPAWSGGSVLAKRRLKGVAPLVSASVHSLSAGVFLLFIDWVYRGGSWPTASPEAWISLLYLIVFGSIIAYSAYVYLLTHMAPARAGTFTYINPVVAVFLGWAILSEAVTWRLLVGGIIILSGLFIVRQVLIEPRRPR